MEAWRRCLAGMPDGSLPDHQLLFLGLDLVDLVNLPTRCWGFKHEMSDREANDLAVAALHWLMLAMPEPGNGDSFRHYGVLYAKGIDFQYVEDRAERLQALTDELATAKASRMELVAEQERAQAKIDALAEKLSNERPTLEEATSAFNELRRELGLKEMEEDDDA